MREILRDAARHLAAVMENATLALFIMDEHQQCTFMNPAAEALTGWSLDEVRGRPLHDVIHHTRPDGTPYPLAECPIDQAFPREMREQGEEVFVHRDGTFYDVAFTASPIRDAGRTVGTVIEVRDIREAKARERERDALLAAERAARMDAERAREQVSRLHGLTAALSTASTPQEVGDAAVAHVTHIFDAAGTIIAEVDQDERALRIIHAAPLDPAIRRGWETIPLGAPVPLAEAARTHAPIFLASRLEWRNRYPHLLHLLDVTGHHANVVLPLMVDEQLVGVLGVAFAEARDFTGEERALAVTIGQQVAQALLRARLFLSERAARHDAQEANRAKGDFLAVMSHELRTPLAAIAGYADLLMAGARGPVTDQQREDLRRIQHAQRHLLGLINQVLNFARVESGALEFAPSSVPVRQALADAEALVAPQARESGLTLETRICESPRAVLADEDKLQQVLLNLLGNAIKFTPAGGQVGLACECDDAQVRIRVSDTGAGIPAAKLEEIFAPFVQLGARDSRGVQGIGLGLAISRDLARGMGGDIEVESTPGAGSTFTLTLPVARP